MGYGWTDNWATSLTAASRSPVTSTRYGLETDTDRAARRRARRKITGPQCQLSTGTYFADTPTTGSRKGAVVDRVAAGNLDHRGDVYTVAGSEHGGVRRLGQNRDQEHNSSC